MNPYLLLTAVALVALAATIFMRERRGLKEVEVHSGSVLIGASQAKQEEAKEAFENYDIPCPTDVKTTTDPTERNPFMNLLNNEWPRNVYSDLKAEDADYDPLRSQAANNDDPIIKQQLDDYFRTNFYNDPTDVFGKSQNQRQFITMPSTTIPNDRDSYQKWLYNIEPSATCKSGGREACLPGTDGGPIVSLNQSY
jgi:hypothetical protein